MSDRVKNIFQMIVHMLTHLWHWDAFDMMAPGIEPTPRRYSTQLDGPILSLHPCTRDPHLHRREHCSICNRLYLHQLGMGDPMGRKLEGSRRTTLF